VKRQVGGGGVGDRLAVVERFQGREFVGVLLDGVGEFVDEPRRERTASSSTTGRFRRPCGRTSPPVDVRLVALGHAADHFTGPRG